MNDLVRVFDPPTLFRIADVVGVITNGILGGIVARRMRFDLVGFLVLSLLTGTAGGFIRDLALTTRPVALTDPAYLGGVFGAAIVTYFVTLNNKWVLRVFIIGDVLAVGCWTATGTIKALSFGLAPLPSILLGVTTAVGGGMIRDVVTGKIPAVFGGNTLYATLAIIGAVEAWLLTRWVSSDAGMAASIVTVTIAGVLARRFRWMLPGAPELTLPRFRPSRLRPAWFTPGRRRP